MLTINSINPKKKNKITSNTFNLFYLPDHRTAILLEESDFIDPILWATLGEMAKTIHSIDKIMTAATKETVVKFYTYRWSDGWKLFGGTAWEGKISELASKRF